MKASGNQPRAFMLPVCTLAVAALLLLLAGFLTVVQIEKHGADAACDARQLELALASACTAALEQLHAHNHDESLVFRITDPTNQSEFTVVSTYNSDARLWHSVPLASGLPALWSASSERPRGEEIIAALTFPDAQREELPRLNDATILPARWLHAAPLDDGRVIRIAWWCEDLDGRLDGRLAGTEIRNHPPQAAENGLFTLFRPHGQLPSADRNAPERRLAEFRNSLLTEGNLDLILDRDDAEIARSHLSYSLPPQGQPPPPILIPHGFGYPDGGKPAMDLNRAVKEQDVEGIAQHIARNLPRFAERSGGLPANENYLKTLAASIIDYADEDQLPTSGADYRGVDSFPFINQIFDRYFPVAPKKARTLAVEVRTFVELWNPTQLKITGAIKLHQINRVGFIAGETRRFYPVMLKPLEPSITLRPNEFRVIELFHEGKPMVYEFPSNFSYGLPYRMRIAYDNRYELFWNEALVDAPKYASPGMTRGSNTAWMREDPKDAYFSGNVLPIFPSQGSVGDPRATWYLQRAFSVANYETNSRWGGRNRLGTTEAEVRLDPGPAGEFIDRAWPDGGADSSLGLSPNSRRMIPTGEGLRDVLNHSLIPYPALQPQLAPTRISNQGFFGSLAELGHIYDPGQWRDVIQADSPPSGAAGGGFTLAIGRKEFARFDQPGLRAAQLLDLFSLGTSDARETHYPQGSRINLNTASREVLRALIAGIQLSADPTQGLKLFPPRTRETGDLFAEAVVHARREGPLRGQSDLATLICPTPPAQRDRASAGTNRAFFGNAEYYSANDYSPSSSWNDAGREELLKHLLPIASFTSKRFRICLAAEVLRSDGSVRSRSNREIELEVDFHREADGSITQPKKPLFRKLHETAY